MAPKLMGSFLLVAVLAGLVGGTGLRALGETHYWLGRIADDSVPSLVQVLQVREDTSLVVRYTRGMILTRDAAEVARYDRLAAAVRADVRVQFAAYDAEITHPHTPEAAQARRLRALLARWLPLNARIAHLAALRTTTSDAAAARLSVGPESQVIRRVTAILDDLTRTLRDEVASRTATAEAAQRDATRLVLAVMAGAALRALALGAALARHIAGPLRQIAATAAAIAAGDADARSDLERGDELGALAASLRTMVAHLRERATTDPLTGLLNHRAFHARLDEEIARAARSGRPLALLLVDLDDFRAINNTHGHQAGDRALVAIAAALRASLRAGDSAGRLGGDEFAALLPEADVIEALAMAERARAAVAAVAIPAGDATIRATTSLGVATLPRHARTRDDLIAAADRAAYAAKDAGKDCVRPSGDPPRLALVSRA